MSMHAFTALDYPAPRNSMKATPQKPKTRNDESFASGLAEAK